jgi:hypothetical protein
MAETLEPPGLQRFASGIAGLDRILGGGLFIGGNYMVMGPPGAGQDHPWQSTLFSPYCRWRTGDLLLATGRDEQSAAGRARTVHVLYSRPHWRCSYLFQRL